MQIERLMDRFARSGVNMILKIDEERMAEGGEAWTVVLSGRALGDGVFVRVDGPDLQACLRDVFVRLRDKPGDWAWLVREGRRPGEPSP